MAQVTLQVVVNDSQLKTLVGKVNALDGKKINIGVSGASQANRDVQDIQSSLGKVNGELTKTVETFGPDGKLVKGVNTYKTGINETTQDTQKLKKATGDMGTTSRKVTDDLAKGQKEAEAAAKQHTKELKQQGLAYKVLGTSLSNFVVRIASYRVVYSAIQKITQGFTEALRAMKAVDDELVTVRKVTGFDDDQIENIKNLSYSTASKYGAEASDYLSAVAAFSRAGYKELATELAELSLKTQIVGDTTQDVANQFLISVDAAYKYKGSVDALTKVLDGANEIDNKYATTIEKIAEGMGIVAPVAAQMHVSIEELTAALGTITAVTQRSGSESARALRALFLNIVGDTKTEIEEGVTWTTGEIAGLQDVIKKYAKDAYDAAKATGGIIDPMRAMEGLSKSLKDGLLTEAELMEMVSDIGGKLRTSQLLALINNWDMYESMLNDYKNAYGSADKEIENAMDSWSRKAAVLKNTWTEFIQKTVTTKEIKSLFDVIVWIVGALGDLATALRIIGGIIIALNIQKWADNLVLIHDAVTLMGGGLKNTVSVVRTFGTSMRAASAEGKTLEAQTLAVDAANKSAASSFGVLSIAVLAIVAAYAAFTAWQNKTEQEHKKIVEETYKQADAAKKSSDEIFNLYKQIANATEGTAEFRKAVEDLNVALGESVPESAKKSADAIEEYTVGKLKSLAATLAAAIPTAEQEFINATDHSDSILLTMLPSAEYFTRGYNLEGASQTLIYQLQKGLSGLHEQLRSDLYGEGLDAGELLGISPDSLDAAIQYYEYISKAKSIIEDYVLETGDRSVLDSDLYTSTILGYLNKVGDAYSKLTEVTDDATMANARYVFAQESLGESANIGGIALDRLLERLQIEYNLTDAEVDAIRALMQARDDLVEATESETDATAANTDSLFANQKALDANASASERAAAAKKDAEAAARKLIPALFDENGELTGAGKAALMASDYLADLVKAEIDAQIEANRANYANMRAQLAALSTDALKAAMAITAAYAAANAASSMGYHVGSLGYGAPTGEVAKALSLLNQISKIEDEIAALGVRSTTVGSYTSSSGGSSGGHSGGSGGHSGGSSSGGSHSSSSSTEDKKLTALKDRISLLKSELSLMQERGDSEDALKAKMREIQNALKAEENYLISIKGSKIDINKLEEEWWSYQNKIQDSAEKTKESEEATAKAIQDAVDAQIALNNAMKERNVHVFNAETGRWEWQADPSAVQSARENLINAAQNLPDGIRENFVREYGITLPGAQSVSNINGTNNYGNTYNFGSFTLTEDQARSMSVYELARLSQTLGVYGNSV